MVEKFEDEAIAWSNFISQNCIYEYYINKY